MGHRAGEKCAHCFGDKLGTNDTVKVLSKRATLGMVRSERDAQRRDEEEIGARRELRDMAATVRLELSCVELFFAENALVDDAPGRVLKL